MIDCGGNYSTGALFVLGTVRARTTNGVATIRNGRLSLNSLVVVFDADGIDATSHQTGHLSITANIVAGAGVGFSKIGVGTLRLSGTNSFSGTLAAMAGEVIAAHPSALGTTAGAMELRGGSLTLTNVSIGAKPLNVIGGNGLYLDSDDNGQTILGQGLLIHGTCSWAGPVTLTTNLFMYGSVVDDMTFSGVIGGPAGLSLYFASTHFSGGTANTYTGPTYVRTPLLTLNKPANALGSAIKGPISVGGIVNLSTTAELRWLNNQQIAPSMPLTLHTNGFVNLSQHLQGISNIVFRGGRIDSGASPGMLEVYGSVVSNPTNTPARFDGFMRLSQPLNVTVADGPPNPDLIINAIISETAAAGIIKQGLGELQLSAPNSYTGPNQVLAGVLQVLNDAALGSTGAGTTVADGATIQIDLSSVLAEPLNIQGTGRGGTNGALYTRFGGTILSPITLAAATTNRSDDNSSGLFLSSTISGTGPLTKTGIGFFTFCGSANNTYSGETFVNAGRLTLQKPVGVTAIPSHLTIGTGALFTSANVVLNQSFLIIGSVTVNRATWFLNGFAEGWSIPDLQGRPPLTLLNGASVQTAGGIFYLPVGGDVVASPGTTGGCTISGNIGLDPGPHKFIVGNGQIVFGGGPDLDVSAVVSQTGTDADIVKEGIGTMRLSGANTFNGSVSVNTGTLIVSNNTALGTSAGSTFVRTNGVLSLEGSRTFNESLVMAGDAPGALSSLGGTNAWTGPVSLTRDTSISVNQILDVSGPVSGPGGITKVGSGTLQFTGGNTNSYGGLTVVSNGTLICFHTQGTAIPGNVLVTGSNSFLNTARFSLFTGTSALTPNANVTVRDGAEWDLFTFNSETIRTLNGNGRVSISVASLTISNDIPCEFSGAFTNIGSFFKRGAGALTLRGNSPNFDTLATVYDGSLIVHGSMPNTPVTVTNTGSLRGSGAVAATILATGTTVAPEPGTPATLGESLAVSSLNLNSGSTLQLDLFGPGAGAGNDVMQITSSNATLAGTLSPTLRYAPHVGDVITLIDKQSAGAVSGTFSGLPEGSLINLSNTLWRISYVGGNGNDVTLAVTNLAMTYAGGRIQSGNDNTTLEANECILLPVYLQNKRGITLTPTNVFLRSLTPGVLVTVAESAYLPIPAGGVMYSFPYFQIRTTPDFVCGTQVSMELQVSVTNEGTFTVPFFIPGSTNCGTPGSGACESCAVVSGQFTSNTPTTIGRLNFSGAPSICFPSKACPGPDADTNLPPARYLTHTFTNTTKRELCLSAQLRFDCPAAPTNALGVAAYLGRFDTNDLCAGYLGDAGQGGPPYAPFSFRVPAGSNFVVMVTARATNVVCNNYSLELFGLPCPPPAVRIAAQPGPGPIRVQWSSAYPDYQLQFVNSLNGPSPHPFSNVVSTPVILDGKYTITNLPAGAIEFFRLAK